MNTGEILLSFDVKQSINQSINQSASANNTELDMQILLRVSGIIVITYDWKAKYIFD
jgi:hypothetical protein